MDEQTAVRGEGEVYKQSRNHAQKVGPDVNQTYAVHIKKEDESDSCDNDHIYDTTSGRGLSRAVPKPVTARLSATLGRVLVSRKFGRNPFTIEASIQIRFSSILLPQPFTSHHVSRQSPHVSPPLEILMRRCRFLLRRTAVRAIASTPSSTVFVAPRSFSSITPTVFRARKQPWGVSAFQKRFLSEEPHKVEVTEAEAKKVEAEEGFAQTAAEAPVEEDLTPAKQEAQAPSTDAEHTVGIDALEQAAKPRASGKPAAHTNSRMKRERSTVPNKTVYVGNLYYEVTSEQLKRVFNRFGEVESVRLVYDNRGLSRG